jgi:hypothetical protein
MSFKEKESIVISVVFLCLLGLIHARQGNLTCETRYKQDSSIFPD